MEDKNINPGYSSDPVVFNPPVEANNVNNLFNNNVSPIVNTQIPVAPSFFSNSNTIVDANNPGVVMSNENRTKFKFNFSKKIKIILAIVVTSIVLVIALFFLKSILFGSGINNAQNLELTFSPSKPIAIQKNDKYGFITSEGKVMIEPKYDGISSDFYGDYAVVYTKNSDGATYYVVDKKGVVKAQASSSTEIESVSKYGIWVINEKLFSSDMKQISSNDVKVSYEDSGYLRYADAKNKTAGIMNYKGNVTYTYHFVGDEKYLGLEVSKIDDGVNETYCIVNKDNEQYAIIDCSNGKIVHDFTTKFITVDDNNIFTISDKDTYETQSVLYVANDKIEYQNNDLADGGSLEFYSFKDQILTVEYGNAGGHDGEYKYYNLKTKQMSDNSPSDSSDSSIDAFELLSGFKMYSCNNGKGIMSGDKVIIPCGYDDISFLSLNLYQYMKSKSNENIMIFEKDDKTSLINIDNKKVIKTFDTTYLDSYDDSTFVKAESSSDDSTLVYNLLSNKSLSFDKNNDVSVYSNYVTAEKDNVKTFYNTDLKEIYKENL